MSPDVQTALALGIVALVACLFAARWWRKGRKKGCGGSCNCGRKS
jgi:hypothetical protein